MMVITTCDSTRLEFEPGSLEILDCAEDFDGVDKVKYECPICGEEHWSRVYGR